MNATRYPGWAGVCSFDPATEPVEVHEVHADALPDEVAAILALTPHLPEDAAWAEREAAALAANAENAEGLAASWNFFVEKHINYEEDGDVLWA